jgi:hypothetical protein
MRAEMLLQARTAGKQRSVLPADVAIAEPHFQDLQR